MSMIIMKKITAIAALVLLASACNSSASKTSSQSSSTPAVSYLTISEWNVRFQEDPQISDLRYQVDPKHDSIVNFSSASLISLSQQFGGACALNNAPLGTLSRISDFSAFTSSGHTAPQNVQIGNWYYYFVPAAGSCSPNASVQNLQSQQGAELQSIILYRLQTAPAQSS